MSWVLKIGGSLYQHPQLPDIIRHAADFAEPPLIVAGGGKFADQVRSAQQRWQFSDAAAHQMALLGMRQYAILLAELSGFALQRQLSPVGQFNAPCIWLPKAEQINQELPQDWSVTSDSIAADLARQISADTLVLIKAVATDKDNTVEDLVDDYFAQIVQQLKTVALISPEQWLAQSEHNQFISIA